MLFYVNTIFFKDFILYIYIYIYNIKFSKKVIKNMLIVYIKSIYIYNNSL